MIPEDYIVKRMKPSEAKEYIRENHYSHGCHNGPSPCYGLYEGNPHQLIGVCMFATPCSENVRASVFGKGFENHVTELHRLYLEDKCPHNSESWFISRCLKRLKEDKPQIWAVLSFSDLTEGHEGTIYKATNAHRIGSTGRSRFYLDQDGRLRHPRQCGENISLSRAKELGWKPTIRESKNRYLWLLADDKRHRKQLLKICKYKENMENALHTNPNRYSEE